MLIKLTPAKASGIGRIAAANGRGIRAGLFGAGVIISRLRLVSQPTAMMLSHGYNRGAKGQPVLDVRLRERPVLSLIVSRFVHDNH